MALPVLTPGADGLNRPEPRLLAGRMLGSASIWAHLARLEVRAGL